MASTSLSRRTGAANWTSSWPSPARRNRRPDLTHLRLCVENKSVVTAHRNRTNRYDDLSDVSGVLHRNKPDAILVATVIVGIAENVLNVPDRVKPFVSPERFHRTSPAEAFHGRRYFCGLSSHGCQPQPSADPKRTGEKFRELPTASAWKNRSCCLRLRPSGTGPIDNVHPPRVERDNGLGIDVDAEFRIMLDRICKAYTARWHL